MKLPVLPFLRLLVCLSLLAPAAALAQTDGGSAGPTRAGEPELVVENRDRFGAIEQAADLLEVRIGANAESDAALVDIRTTLDGLARELIAAGVSFRPRLAEINARLDEIGPARGADEPAEPPALTAERQNLFDEKAEINALLGEAEALSLRVNRMIEQIAHLRRTLFANSLSRRYDISMAFSPAVLDDIAREDTKLRNAVASWLRFVSSYKLRPVLLASFYALLAAGVLLVVGRRLIAHLAHADPERENPSYLARLSVAFWSTLLPSAALAVFLAATYFFYDYYGVLRSDIAQIMVTLFKVIATVFFVCSLSSSVFSPKLPNWRMVPVRDGAARSLFWLTVAMAVVMGADVLIGRVNHVMGSPLSLTVAKSLVATILIGLLVAAFGLVRPFEDENGKPRGWHPYVRTTILALAGGIILAALLGYIGLARFISQQIVVTGAILSTMYLGYQSAGAVSEIGAFGRTTLGKALERRFNLDETTKDQLGLVFGMAINIVVLAIGIPLILLQWGFQWGDIETWSYRAANELRIGSITISIVGIITGIVIFVLGYFGTRLFQRWLDGKVMTRGRVNPGLRNSIGTAVGYAGIALAGLVAISAAGLDLSSIALVAGALSLGIGFGLQNIVNNFVSGLILLAERPFKVGDWIVASGAEGTVKKISVRATELETFQRQTVIVPNSLLINASVGNWTHRNKLGRVEIRVGAGYDSDPRRVQQLLLEIVRAQPQALKNPEPMVAFLGFGVMSLDFEVRAFLADVTNQANFVNEVRFQIYERFRGEGIDIPFTQPTGKWSDAEQFALADGPQAPAPEQPKGERKRAETGDDNEPA